MKKRIVCVLLVFALLLNILPVTALAGVQGWTGNTEAENGDVLSQLSDLTGGQVEEARALLESLGLLDGQGNLNVNKSVLLGGAEMTLDEVMELLDDPETDLSRIAEVDGVPVALGDLRTMILIEKELARIQETYFSGQAFTPEQMVMLEGLLGQIENEGISVHPMGLEGTGLVLTITPSPNNPTEINYELYNEANAVLEYDLSLSGELPREGVTFHWKRVLGLFDSGYVKVDCEVQSATSGNFLPWEDEVTTLAPHGASGLGPGLRLNNASEFSGKLTVTLGSRWGNGFTTYVDGIVPFFIEFYASEGLTIAYGEDRGEVCAVPITVKNRREWQLSVDGGGSTCRFEHDGDTPGWNILNNDQAHDLWLSCRRMYENEGPYTYQVETTLGAMVTHTTMTGIIGYIKNALPMPVGYLGDYSLLGYYWNDQEVNLNANPARLTNGNTPYLTIDANEAVNKHKISFICSTMDYPPARLEANWPAQAALCKSIDGTVTDLHHIGGYLWFQTVSSRVTIYDKTPPGVQSIEIPAGTYTSGQLVPITITFSEPVRSENLSFLLNGERFGAGDLLINSTGNKAVGFYRVKDIDATTILVSSVSGLRDLFGNTTSLENNGYKGWSFEDEVILRSTLMKRAVEGIELSRETVPPDDAQSGVTVTLRLNQHEAFRNKYANYNLKMGKAPFALKVTSPAAALPHIIETELCEEGNTVCARAVVGDLVPVGSGMTYTLDVIAYEEGDEKGTIVGGKSASFWLSGAEFVDGLEIIYPEGDRPQLSLCETYRPRLGLSFRGNPTYKTGTWSSSNLEIATIDEDGQVGLTGTSVGRVYFTFTADDGGLEDKNPFHVKKAVSREYTIIIGDGIVLLIPGEAGKIISRKGQDATVRWSGNVGMKSPEGAQYTIELFRGGRPGPNDVPLFTAKEGKDANSTVIPGGYLTELGTPAYTIRVSMPHPEIPSEVLTAFSSIDIHPKPAGVELTRPDSIYVPDSRPVTIPWTILNYEAGHTTGELLVERVSTVNGKDIKEEVLKVILDEESGSCTLTPRAVNGLRETYMIFLKAKNPADPVYSSDSFPLYVYNGGALKLEVRGQKVTEITMSNESRVSGSLPTRTRDVMELREELGLIEYIGINYGDYSWGQLMDGIKWATSDRDKVSVNYRQGGLYEDISRFSMSTYLPETKMALSSVVDGTATITATHANTGMEARVTVDVKTLRNKFFIFQFTPMCRTEVSYKDKKGASKALFSNDEGVLALYEPEGIASDILVRSTDGEGNVWLGTIQEGTLLSGERDATRLQLYPLNNLKLRRAARAEIFLKKPDGSPYTGILTLRGGVYKNGGYCQNAGILGNDNQGTVRDGCQDQIVHIGPDGKLTIYMDVTQFWSAENGETYFPYRGLSPAEDIQYIFEVRDLDGFYPLLIYSNGNLGPDEVVRSAESIVTLDPYSGAPRPFIAHLAVDYGLPGGRLIDLKSSKGRVGPNDTYPEVNLLTTVLLWGQERDGNYDLKLCDEYGFVPGAQAGRVATYPFSSIPVVRNTILLSNASITKSGWVAPKKDIGLRLRLLREGIMLSELPAGPRLCDLTLVPTKLKDTPEIAGLVLELKGRSGVGENADMGSNNKILDGMMQVLNRLGGPADGSLFKMIITPSADNSVFNAFVWAGYNSLDLDDVDYDENGLAFDYKLAEGSLNVAPNLNDLTDMAKGSYDPKKTFKEAKKNQGDGEGTSSVDFGGQLEGYYEALIKYNFEEEKWEIYVLGGGFTAGFGITYTYTVNAEVGPVPITGTFALNGALQLDFKSAIRYSEQNGLPWADTVTAEAVNDYLTTLRINAYVEAFGGLGFDYSVVALKIGLFGKVNLDNQNKFLSRPYLADEEQRQLKGQGLQLSGEVGIKFVAQFLLISYELILASGGAGATWTFNDWDAIDEYWKGAGSGLGLKSAAGGFRPVSSTATLESRDYLETFARSWGARKQGISLFALDDDNGLEQLQSNAYPNSLPLVTADGLRLLYVCDHNSARVEETRIYATERNSLNEQFPEGQEIASPPNFEGFGDSSLSLAGRKSFAVAAWVRQSASLSKGAGEPVNAEEQALLMNGTEIVASVFRGEGGWKSTRLTTDSTPDLAPVVAVSASKDQAIAVWRSVYAANTEDLLNFTERDRILYSHVWNLNDEWFPTPRVLYDGTSGAVKGITAAMLGDGEILVAYTLDTGGRGNPADYEIGYTLMDHNYKVVRSAIITHNDQIDENPQLTTAVFGKGANSVEHFVLGWHNVHNGIDDIRLAAIDREGTLSNSFITSIAQAGSNGAEIGGNFHFAKMGYGWPELSKVAILWSETMASESGERDHGMLRAVRLVPEGDKVLVSAPLDVAELPARTLLDHFDAFLEVKGDGVKAVIQGTGYSEVNPDDPATYEEYSMGDGRVLRLPKEETKLYTATGMYANKVRVASLAVDYRNLVLNSLVPIQFTICNMGTDPIVGGAIEVGGNDWHFSCKDDLICPNESKTLTVWYHMGDKVENLDYTLTANFVHNNMDAGRHTVGGSVYLDYPDLGISKLQTVAEDRGLRMLQMTLYNISPATLAGNKGRSVHLGFYDDALLEHIQEVTCSTPGVTVNADKTLTISGEEALGLIDAGAFTLVLTFNLGRYLADEAGGKQEIPDAGIRLHAHVWAEEAVDGDGDKVILPEFTANNNTTTVLFPSALALSSEAVSISVEQSLTADGVTEAAVSVRNNSLLRRTSGNLVVTLFGQDGNILEQQQSCNCGSNELIELEGEETRTFTFTFGQNGSRVAAFYGDMFLDAGNARLAALNFEGLQARLADFVPGGGGSAYEYTAPDTTLDTVLVNFMTEDPRATVTVNGQEAVLSHRIGLPLGETTRVNLEVTAADGATTQDYLLQVRRVGGLDPVNSPTFEDLDYTYYFEDFEWFTPDRRVTALIEDWGDATRLVDITLDGVSIGAENYELWDADTLAIRQGFLESLDEGTHDLKVTFDWGWTILTIKLAHRPPTYEVWVGPYPYCLPEDCFPNAAAGYGEQAAREILIVNMGTGTIENLTAALTDGSAFEISTPLSAESITPHGSADGRATFSIRPRTGLAVGNYTDTLTITGSNDIFETLELFFTVEEAPPADKILRSITAPAAITGVANGTAKTAVDLGLPDAVELVTDDGNISASVNAEINWNVAGSSYDPDNTSGQTFIVGGTVTLPDGVANPDNISLDVTTSVTVDAAVPRDKTLVEITAPAAITGIANGTAKTAVDLGLPDTVELVTDDGNVQAEINWNVAGSSYDPAITTEQTFTVNGTVTVPDGVVNPDNISLGVTISVTVDAVVPKDKILVEVTAPAAITGVANGTAKTAADLGLPGAVTLVTDDGNVQAEVVWNVAGSSYDPAITTEQTFTVNGIVTLPDGVTNPDNISLDVTISVTVGAAVPKDKTLVEITAPAAITGVANGTAKTVSALGLPGTVELVTDDGNVQAEVNWDVASSSYDPSIATEQTFTVNGIVTLPDGVVNPDSISLDVTISVTVDAAVPKDKTLLGITAPAAITGVANGTAKTAADLGLPGAVTLVTDDGNVQAEINWNVAPCSYDPSITTEQTFTVNGTVTLPDGVVNPDNISLDATVSVTVDAAVPKDKTLVEITVPAAITGVANGTAKTASALGLPDTVELVTDDGNVQAKVNWDIATSSYDPAITTEQTFTVSGIVTLPAGVTNPNAVSLYTGVLVTVNARTQGGGSPGGGSDRADRGAGVTILPDMRPDQPVIAGISITPTAGGSGHSTAIILQQPVADAVAEALANAKARGKTANGIGVSINIDLPDTANPPDIVLPRDTLQTLISAGVRQLVINGVNVILTLNLEALQEIQRQSVGNVTIAIKPAKDLPGAAKKLIGTRPAYDVTISYVKNGKTENVVSLGKGSATLSIPYTPSADEAVGWLFGVYADGKGQAERIPDSAYDPNSGNVILDGNHFSIYGVGYTPPSGKYTDIADHWARDSADYAVGRGLFTGTSETTFSPNTAMDRGMTVTVLGRLAGADVSAYKTSSFSDVAAGKYYLPYVEWAYKKGIVSGIGHGEFAPERAITREELALILQNYAKATGYTLPAICRAAVFADNSSIGSSYEAAAGTMQQAGIMVGGTGNKFNPQAPATRAEFATMLHHYIRLTIDPATARGWAKDDAGQYHYYREGKSPTGWQTIDGVRYFFNTNGTLKTGWVRDGNNWRFYSGNKATTGWLNQGSGTNEKRYYFDANAVMVSGKWLMLEDKWYYFNTDGSLARNTTIDGYNVDESGVRKAK